MNTLPKKLKDAIEAIEKAHLLFGHNFEGKPGQAPISLMEYQAARDWLGKFRIKLQEPEDYSMGYVFGYLNAMSDLTNGFRPPGMNREEEA